nr:MAG TPA: hypothetical protein [Caudoviricetes sp.]
MTTSLYSDIVIYNKGNSDLWNTHTFTLFQKWRL